MTVTLAALESKLVSDIAQAQSRLDQWKKKLEANPTYAFQWADDAIAQAARLEISAKLQKMVQDAQARQLNKSAILLIISSSVQRDLVHYAVQNSNHSTSQCSNLLEGAKVAVLAELHAFFTDSI